MKTVFILTKTILNEAKTVLKQNWLLREKATEQEVKRTYATKACVHQRAHETAPKQKR